MTLQDQLRAESLETADTDALLSQAADQIDDQEARIAELEAALTEIRVLAVGVVGAV